MNRTSERVITLLAAALALPLASSLLAACDNNQPKPIATAQITTSTTATPTTTPTATPDTTEPSSSVPFVFTRENFPRMDGSTSTVPLAQAAACVLLGEPREDVAELAQFNRTTQSYRNLAAGLCDILIVNEPSPEVLAEMKEQGFEFEIKPIATDALVFVVNATNPVDSLTLEQLRAIYTGKITNWKQVGGDDIDIVPFQRNAEAGSQVLMEKLVMEGQKMTDLPSQTYPVAFGMGELIDGIKGFDGSANAIGYTVFYYAEDMRMAQGLKIISVNGVKPDDDTIRNGEYPFLNPYYVAIAASEPPNSPARIMYDWLQSDEGQALAKREGYVSVR